MLVKPHPELTHFDLSYNNFNDEDTKIIAKNLVFNQYIYGFHYEGHGQYAINARGFLKEVFRDHEQPKKQIFPNTLEAQSSMGNSIDNYLNDEEQVNQKIEQKLETYEFDDKIKMEPIFFRRIRGTEMQGYRKDVQVKDCCWICEGWEEVKFTWKPGESGWFNKDPIFLHLDFEDYQPMIMSDVCKEFQLYRLCPPNRTIHYFFSNPNENLFVYAKNQKTTSSMEHSQLRNFGIQITYQENYTVEHVQMKIVNFVTTSQPKLIIDSSKHYIPCVFSKPRDLERCVEIHHPKAKLRLWSVETSIFKDFIIEDGGIIEQCFEFDFEAGKFQKYIPSQKNKEELKIIKGHNEIELLTNNCCLSILCLLKSKL